jgi:hypothetical protein
MFCEGIILSTHIVAEVLPVRLMSGDIEPIVGISAAVTIPSQEN